MCMNTVYVVHVWCIHSDGRGECERWGAGVETQKNVRGEIGDGVEYHLMKPTPRR